MNQPDDQSESEVDSPKRPAGDSDEEADPNDGESDSGATDGTSPLVARAEASQTDGNVPLEVQFSVTVTPKSDSETYRYQWEFGDGSDVVEKAEPTHVYREAGLYEPTVTVIRQSDEKKATDTIGPIRISNRDHTLELISATNQTKPGQQVDFRCAESPRTEQTTYTWWKDGESTDKTERTVGFSFTSEGTHEIKCVADIPNAGQLSDKTSIEVTEKAPEPTEFEFNGVSSNPSRGVAPLIVSFDPDYTYTGDKSDISFTWQMGDGTTKTGRSPSHVYRQTGQFRVSVTMKASTFSKTRETTINVDASDIDVELSVDTGETDQSTATPRTVDFDCSVSGERTDIDYEWVFGDGNRTETESGEVEHTYDTPPKDGEQYFARCKVETQSGAKGSDVIEVDVVEQTIDSISIMLDDSKTDNGFAATRNVGLECNIAGGDPPFEVEWNYDNGTIQPIGGLDKRTFPQTFGYTDPSGSPYRPSCTVTDATGASRTAVLGQPIEVSEDKSPTIEELKRFPKSPSVGDSIEFISTAIGGNTGSEPLRYSWDFGDGNTKQGQAARVSHTYQSAGDYTVELDVTDADRDTATQTIEVSVSGK